MVTVVIEPYRQRVYLAGHLHHNPKRKRKTFTPFAAQPVYLSDAEGWVDQEKKRGKLRAELEKDGTVVMPIEIKVATVGGAVGGGAA